MVGGHLHDDHEGGDRGLRHRGEEGHHAQHQDRRVLLARQQQREVRAEAGTHRERGGEDAAGDLRGEDQPDHCHLHQREGHRQRRAALERGLGFGIAGAVGDAAAGQADQRGQQAAHRREGDRLTLGDPAEAAGQAARGRHQDPGEDASEQAPGHAAGEHRPDPVGPAQARQGAAEVGVVAQHRERHQAGEDHRGERRAVGLEGAVAAHLLDREHDAAERGVESRGDAGAAAGDDEVAARGDAAVALAAGEQVHHRGADLHRGAFAAHRGAAEQPAQGQEDLRQRDAQRQQLAAHLSVVRHRRRDRLRDAAALGAVEEAARDPRQRREAGGRDQQGEPGALVDQRGVGGVPYGFERARLVGRVEVGGGADGIEHALVADGDIHPLTVQADGGFKQGGGGDEVTRCHWFTIGPLGILSQMEGVYLVVFGFPTFGNSRADFTVRPRSHQTFIQVALNIGFDSSFCLGRVQSCWLSTVTFH